MEIRGVNVDSEGEALLDGEDCDWGRFVGGLNRSYELVGQSHTLWQRLVLDSEQELSRNGASVAGVMSERGDSGSMNLLSAVVWTVGLLVWGNVDEVAGLLDNE